MLRESNLLFLVQRPTSQKFNNKFIHSFLNILLLTERQTTKKWTKHIPLVSVYFKFAVMRRVKYILFITHNSHTSLASDGDESSCSQVLCVLGSTLSAASFSVASSTYTAPPVNVLDSIKNKCLTFITY